MRKFLSVVFIWSVAFSFAQNVSQSVIINYIEEYSHLAIIEMYRYKIPASITLAQAILESYAGTSDLAKNANNHFGIKCHVGWDGMNYIKTDDEEQECFRKYFTVEESYRDHTLFLWSRPRYGKLFLLPIYDYKLWCYGLKETGYATLPEYAEKLIKIIEKYHLDELDHFWIYDTEEEALSMLKIKLQQKRG